MIHIYDGNKFKVKKYKTSDHLIKALNIDIFQAKDVFDKYNEKGVNLYCSLIPKMDSDEETELFWDFTSKNIENTYWTIVEQF